MGKKKEKKCAPRPRRNLRAAAAQRIKHLGLLTTLPPPFVLRPDVDTLLQAECKLWDVSFVEPENKKKEKKDAKEARQTRVRKTIKEAETKYNTERMLPQLELQAFFFNKPAPIVAA